ncbi:hypothetical protein NE237_000437 [Protea cynaroides]|uniref:Uncharacterized protein n=1 Tax=Protea cynaroides TaxID=273540 RepID=A0A9Q0KS16_9MAGN|nr:hypothetical protein NE237_000437 [Protea cynaroides]
MLGGLYDSDSSDNDSSKNDDSGSSDNFTSGKYLLPSSSFSSVLYQKNRNSSLVSSSGLGNAAGFQSTDEEDDLLRPPPAYVSKLFIRFVLFRFINGLSTCPRGAEEKGDTY